MAGKKTTKKPASAPRGKRGRKPRDPETVRRALELAARTSPEEAAEILERENPRPPGARENPKAPSSRQIRDWQKGAYGQAAVAAEVKAATSPPEPAAPQKAEPVPPELAGVQRRLWIIRQRIDRIRDALAKADAALDLPRISPLQGVLTDLLKQEAILEAEATPSDPQAEERRWRAAAESAVKKIKAGCADARERMGALLGRPFPYAAGMVAR